MATPCRERSKLAARTLPSTSKAARRATDALEDQNRNRGNLRVDILRSARLVWVGVVGHVPRAASASGVDWGLEGWGLEVLGLDLGRLGRITNVAGAAAAGGLKVAAHGRCVLSCSEIGVKKSQEVSGLSQVETGQGSVVVGHNYREGERGKAQRCS